MVNNSDIFCVPTVIYKNMVVSTFWSYKNLRKFHILHISKTTLYFNAVVPDLFCQITLFGLFEIWNYPQIKGCFSTLLNKVQIQITLPKMAVYPQRVNYPSSGTTAPEYVHVLYTILAHKSLSTKKEVIHTNHPFLNKDP